MKSILSLALVFAVIGIASAQTPIDDLQKQNLRFLENQESQGYGFRSQIITEFDPAHASQNVNIKLSSEYTYVIVALGDSNIPKIDLTIKPAKGAAMKSVDLGTDLAGQAYQLTPSKSGRFKISIQATGLASNKPGFISFMVLRK